MASPQAENGHVRIANELYTQILMRDFSKRQRAILDLIVRLSYGCGKKSAHIPLTRYFVLCGIPANKVRKELDSLRALNVIDWSDGVYWLNKDYDQWTIEAPTEDLEHEFNELLKHNILSKDDQNGHAQNGHDQKVHEDMPKTVIKTCPKRSYDLPEIPRGSKAEEAPITKDNNIKTKEISTITTRSDLEPYIDEIEFRMQMKMIDPNHIVQGNSRKAAVALFEEQIPIEFVLTGIDKAFENYVPKGRLDKIRNFAYCAPKIEQQWMEQKTKNVLDGGMMNGSRRDKNQRSGGKGTGEDQTPSEWDDIESKFYN